jgi:hypothetical protein
MCSDQGAPIETKAVKVSLLPDAGPGEAFAKASRFRDDLFDCLTARGDELFELVDALLCADGPGRHVYGRNGRSSDQMIPGWPYSFVAALETGRTSWCQLLDAVRLGPEDDVAGVTAAQVRRVVEDLIDMGRWHIGDRDILVVFDAGYDAPRMVHLLRGLPVEGLGRMRSDRVMRKPVRCRGSPRPRAGGPRSTARSSASPSRTPGASRTRQPCRSPTSRGRRSPGRLSAARCGSFHTCGICRTCNTPDGCRSGALRGARAATHDFPY